MLQSLLSLHKIPLFAYNQHSIIGHTLSRTLMSLNRKNRYVDLVHQLLEVRIDPQTRIDVLNELLFMSKVYLKHQNAEYQRNPIHDNWNGKLSGTLIQQHSHWKDGQDPVTRTSVVDLTNPSTVRHLEKDTNRMIVVESEDEKIFKESLLFISDMWNEIGRKYPRIVEDKK